MRTKRPNNGLSVLAAAILLAAALLAVLTGNADAFFRKHQHGANPASIRGNNNRNGYYNNVLLRASDELRGGSTAIDLDEIESSDEEAEETEGEEEESDYEEEEEDVVSSVAKSAKTALGKATQKAAQKAVKTTVSAALKPKKKKKKSAAAFGLMKYFRVPYIVKACLNPFVFIQMTKGYWASLFDVNYMKEKEDSSQDLRNALEQKARQGGAGGGGRKGRKKMKPGQAKTLSDLPQLNM